MGFRVFLLVVVMLPLCYRVDAACSNGKCKVCVPYTLCFWIMPLISVFSTFLSHSFRIFDQLDDECSSNGDCEAGLYCFSCPLGYLGSRCVRSSITDQFKLIVRSYFLNVKVLNMLSSDKNSETIGVIQILVNFILSEH